ncbi:M1 family aminopeptidase [Telmatobacter sp. DSM 110680]|uniref:Aminopeptidase n=1 Tax=Telmatobacter sp. DSM 110680 TaxID=3036704 RepID=A0AAU7DE10_9BACT
MKIGRPSPWRESRLSFVCSLLSALTIAFSGLLQAQRLTTTVRPVHYTLTLSPDLKAATFTGSETIDVTLAEPANSITLNAHDLTFESVEIETAGKKQTATVSLDQEKEQATFTVRDKLAAGKAKLIIRYSGILNGQLRGFYLSKTARRNYAVTQFESTDARRAFPSFDEPAFKATYDISLVVDRGDTGISNGPIVSDTPGPAADKHTLKFLTTPKMSTYLVAFLVGDFQCSSGEQDGVAIRTCATPDKVALTKYGVDVAKYVLHYYNNYFGIPYPLKKLDLIGLPDFEAGAMENFGAITYRETALLVDPKTASINAKTEVALVIAHEMAHQWFGDLVTMQWWDNIWLNEGFATWMENKPVAAMHPEWNIDQAVAAGLDATLNLDAQPTTRAIRARADTPAEIEQMFDGISYGKAGNVLLSVENYLGPETFRQGVHNYLAAHLYGNATAEDFWNAQTSTSHKPVDKIMESLVAQAGVPLLTFGQPHDGKVEVSQKRFYLTPSVQPDEAQKWTLPVCFKSDGKQDCQLLTPESTFLNVPQNGLFFANANGKGYYRTSYAPSDYAALASHVEDDLTPSERISLIGDEWAQVRANKAIVGQYMNLVEAVKSDASANVVSTALNGLGAIDSRIAATPEEKAALDSWVRQTFAPEYAKLGAPSQSDSPNKKQLRALLFAELGDAKDPRILAEARDISAKYLADANSTDPNLAQTALQITARNGDAALFDQLQKIFETSTNPEIQIGALRLLAMFENPELAQRALQYAVSDKVRNQDAALQLAISLDNEKNRDLAWRFIQDHWDDVKKEFTPEMGNVLVGATSTFCSESARDDVSQFFASHTVPDADQELKHAIERINGCIELRNLQEPQLKTWLATQPRASGAETAH